MRQWNTEKNPRVVVIGVHGIAGVSRDFRNLALALEERGPEIALVAYDVRGQGMDPRLKRRGDILHPKKWYKDLTTFTELVRQQHPKAKIIWAGESMGGLIILNTIHTLAQANCDGVILSSPIVSLSDEMPPTKRFLLKTLATFFPRLKLSLESLSGKDDVKVSSETTHQNQAQKNPWHVERFTLRLLNTLGNLIQNMEAASQKLTVPVLILSAGKDVFISAEETQQFVDQLPKDIEVTHRHYMDSYHLLFYDENRKKVIQDTINWLEAR